MKSYVKYLFFAAAFAGLSSCSVQDMEDNDETKPQYVSPYDYLDNYDVLKSYVSDSASPDFKLGVAVNATEFNRRQKEFLLAKSNFHEVTADNAMKYSSVVGNDGNMNFAAVKAFVDVAKAEGMTIYGHTLAWHSQQNNRYLNGLLKDKEIETENGGGDVEIEEARTCIEVEAYDMVAEAWDNQFWIVLDSSAPFKEGDKWSVSMDVRAAHAASPGTQTHEAPGTYLHYVGIGNVSFTTDWTTFTASGTFEAAQNGGYSIAFNLNDYAKANKYYFDNISFKINGVEKITNGNCDDPDGTGNFVSKERGGSGIHPARIVDKVKYTVTQSPNIIPLTPEEKKDTLVWAMDKWIKGMMEATDGYVTAWDVVNEAISGSDGDRDGKYDLWSADNGDPANNFYWQDYLGDEDYVRVVVEKARRYYKGTEPLKLFINDYNLESDWDDNAKLKSLIKWIEIWESDGKTRIDGIGTQMHVSCYENAGIQKSKEEHYVKMLRLMAATGKLVKISELDMAYVGADGKEVPTVGMTEEQHKAMAAYYTFIVKKYFEIIPPAQQYGITQWCITDSPIDSFWRKGLPVGLWDCDYNRKHTYAGFADGLQGE